MRNELLSWAEDELRRSKESLNDRNWRQFEDGYCNAMSGIIDKINSIPVPSVEGYFSGTVYGMYDKSGGVVEYVLKDDALTALRELKEDCDYAALVSEHEQQESVTQLENVYRGKLNALQAEVERLRDGWISVEDRLPTEEDADEDKSVNVLVKGNIQTHRRISHYKDVRRGFKITHWSRSLPLPNPPKQ